MLWGCNETHFAPSRPLLEAVTDLLRSFTHGQVVLNIAAVPLVGLHDHAQGKILRQGVCWRPARFCQRSTPTEEVGTCRGIILKTLNAMLCFPGIAVSF